MNLTLILTVAPPLLIVAYIIKADKFPEPTGLCISTFLLGCLLCIPAASLNSYFIPDLSYAYLAGFTEETLKFAAIYFYIRKSVFFLGSTLVDTAIQVPPNHFQTLQYRNNVSSRMANRYTCSLMRVDQPVYSYSTFLTVKAMHSSQKIPWRLCSWSPD